MTTRDTAAVTPNEEESNSYSDSFLLPLSGSPIIEHHLNETLVINLGTKELKTHEAIRVDSIDVLTSRVHLLGLHTLLLEETI